MLNLAINTYIHILCIMVVISCIVVERISIKPKIKWKTLLMLLRLDGLYGFAAIVVVTTGLLNWMQFGKGYEYYATNSIFILKFTLFIIVGLLSIYPTVSFFKYKKRHRKDPPEEVNIPNVTYLKWAINAELILMAIIPLLATLMANGFG
ncbi:MAG: DUF2214 family protein [Bacteroidota bacterium]